ncbi:DUF1778 domain-containing protein [Demequina litorisediminis]|uniref:DUF1778 domain-containing protein n=1 Tax=Demequina litorisediminis TaxID=1849022 RepID=A0ABQ6IE99_9MICO|nr:DUF1778 domain-containing protein [Demequina litorisediminis]GMA36011.1 hypothetical protein GCM10025876_22150 [Demequina litorisediminis]
MATISRDTQIQVRVSSADKEFIRRAAEASGQDLSTFVLQHAKEAAEEVLAERWTFTLSDEDYAEFMASLDAPAQKIPGLDALLERPSPFSDR